MACGSCNLCGHRKGPIRGPDSPTYEPPRRIELAETTKTMGDVPPDGINALTFVGGKLPSEVRGRDAVHLAVIPVMADVVVYPGQHLGMVTPDGHVASPSAATTVGIVDPYLKNPVFPGEWFYLFLYPRTITSLRHVWTHPSFPREEVVREVETVVVPTNRWGVPLSPSVESSMKWLRNYFYGKDIEMIVDSFVLSDGAEYVTMYGTEWEGDIDHEVFPHIETVSGHTFVERPVYYSCSC
jgi:hypothetical protein